MLPKTLKIATRKSKLAICQANYVKNELKKYHPNIHIELIPIITMGDTLFPKINTKNKIKKGIFIKELEHALLEYRADIAVHSMKDITISLPKNLTLPVICKRDDPRDAFVSLKYPNIESLPTNGIIGTSSLRRQCQIKKHRPDLVIKNLRGNIDTRLKKLHQKKYDAIILAVAGLCRLQLNNYIRTAINPSYLLPAMGQGSIAIECRASDNFVLSLLSSLHHQETAIRINAERIVTTYLESYCQLPIASYAEIKGKNLWLRALIGLPDGSKIIYAEGFSPISRAEKLSLILAKDLLIRFKKQIKKIKNLF